MVPYARLTARSMTTTSLPRRALKGASRLHDVVRPPAAGITVLIYHRVGAATGGQMNLDADVFERQLEWLAATQRVIDLDTAVTEISGAGPTRSGVALTFDDGTADWIDVVAPLLVRHRIPATFYLTTGYPEGELPLPDGEPSISWNALAELAATGLATIGSHTHTHRLLDRLDPAEIDRELDLSTELIGDRLGLGATHFAYPKAVDPSEPARLAVRRRFRSAALAGTRVNVAGGDPYSLRRSPIQAADSFADFTRKATGGLGFEDTVRRGLNRLRYRGATS